MPAANTIPVQSISMTPEAEAAAKRRELRQAIREEKGLTLEQIARSLPGVRWGDLKPSQRKNRIDYVSRIERYGTPCEKLARRLAAIYGTGHFLFLSSAETKPSGQEENRRTRLRFRPAKPAAARSRRRRQGAPANPT